MTKYGAAILRIINNSDNHLTADDVFNEIRKEYESIVLATVYNNLNSLWEEGHIKKISLAGSPDRYDKVKRHDHLVCAKCGALADCDLGDMTQELTKKLGQEIDAYDLKLFYVCEKCKKED